MRNDLATIIHVNVSDFVASVMALKNPALHDRAFVVTHPAATRRVVITPSRRAFAEGIYAGMPIATALCKLPTLQLVSPDTLACNQVTVAMLNIASHYTPTVQSDGNGHLYLDVAGTTRLFGAPIDCAVRLRNEIQATLNLAPAVAVATNKLVAKVATRTIRPDGITQIRQGEEASFLAMQDITLLPGVGPRIGRLLTIAGFHTIGAFAALDDNQVIALLGKRGLLLRDAGRGWDPSLVDGRDFKIRTIQHRIDLSEPATTLTAIQSAIIVAVEHTGLQMRKERLACRVVQVTLFWADGGMSKGKKRSNHLLTLDREIFFVAWQATSQAMQRRIRIRACTLSLEQLYPADQELDLFALPREKCLQTAADALRIRFGAASVTRATTLFHV